MPQLDSQVDLERGTLFAGQVARRYQRILQVLDRDATRSAPDCPRRSGPVIAHRAVPYLSPQGVKREPFGLLGDSIGIKPLARDRARRCAKRAADPGDRLRYATSCMRACLNVYSTSGKRLVSLQELRSLQALQRLSQLSAESSPTACRTSNGTRYPMTAADWSSRLSPWLSRSMREASRDSTVAGTSRSDTGLRDGVGTSARRASTPLSDERPHALLQEERVSSRSFDEEALQRLESAIGAGERAQQFRRAPAVRADSFESAL